jgi:hypothetical protein
MTLGDEPQPATSDPTGQGFFYFKNQPVMDLNPTDRVLLG